MPAIRKCTGENNHNAKLTADSVRAMRRDWANGISVKELCAKYSVAAMTARDAIRRHSWKHVKDDEAVSC